MKTDILFKRYIKNDPFQRKEIRFYSIGSKSWFLNGNGHREDGPAIEYASGNKEWYHNDFLHRLDGPAVEWNGGAKDWFYNGKYIDCQDQETFERIIKLKAFW